MNRSSHSASKPIEAPRAVLLVAAHALREMCWSRRTLVAGLLVMVPAVIALVVRADAPPVRWDEIERSVLVNLQLALIPLLCLFFGASILRDSMEDFTLSYLLTRPLGRARIAFGYLLGVVVFLMPIVAIDLVTTHSVMSLGRDAFALSDEGAANARLWRQLGVGMLGVIFYSTLYIAIGVTLRFPTFMGLFTFTIFDLVFGFMQGPPRAISPAAHFEELLGADFQTRAQELMFNPEPMGPKAALLRLAIVWVLLLFVIGKASARRDFVVFDKAQNG